MTLFDNAKLVETFKLKDTLSNKTVEEVISGMNEPTPVVELSAEQKLLNEFQQKIRDLEKKVNNFEEENIKPVNAEIKIVSDALEEKAKEEQAIREAFQKALEEHRLSAQELARSRADLNMKRYSLEQELRKLRQEINSLSADQAKLLKQIAAKERLLTLEHKLDAIAKQLPTWELVKPFQVEDIFFTLGAFEEGKKGVLNANDMGLGKTAEAAITLYFMRYLFYEKYGRLPLCLWLTKKSLVESSTREIQVWDEDAKIVSLVQKKGNHLDKAARDFFVQAAITNNAILITNYDAMESTAKIMQTDWDIVVIDEVHKLKGGANDSGPTAIWKNAKQIADKAAFNIFLTGSPIMNHPKEAWAYLHIFDPVRFPSLRRFKREYCFGYGEGVKVDFEQIINVLADQTIRRKSDDEGVDIALPEGRREFRYIEMTDKQRALYNQMRTSFFIWLGEQGGKALTTTAIIAQLTRLRQIALCPSGIKIVDPITKAVSRVELNESGKIDEAMEIIEELLNQQEQVVVFSSQFNEPLEEVKRRVEALDPFNGHPPSVGLVVGGSDHATLEEMFQNKMLDVLCVNMMTGSEGLNLQKNPGRWPGGAKHAIFLDLWWNPEQNRQAEKRIYRQGADQDCIFHIIQAEDSVDAFIASILEEKQEMIEGIMDSDEMRSAKDWKEKLADLL